MIMIGFQEIFSAYFGLAVSTVDKEEADDDTNVSVTDDANLSVTEDADAQKDSEQTSDQNSDVSWT